MSKYIVVCSDEYVVRLAYKPKQHVDIAVAIIGSLGSDGDIKRRENIATFLKGICYLFGHIKGRCL